ncbi:glucans biosynthesis protein C [Brevibacterium sandarakinum]|uniref:Glucans biosynthesis protein C n=1 Tax=Brevibacterium sandarakinum TaxID=629680 RepID=A0A1H1S7K6_BRESA|nr:acyltransferase family protein [Brevibacterium sandarakinum]SDS43746.1 glucans biosynthesis protein C [Brevibacterium sandarakinum]
MESQSYYHNRGPTLGASAHPPSGAVPDLKRQGHNDSGHPRLHGLDALRGGALLLGILLHALMSFHTSGGWLIADVRNTVVADTTVYVIHLFRMTLFMLLAGYFGNMVLRRRGAASYVRDRLVRILSPIFVFWPLAVILPMAVFVPLDAARRNLPAPSASAEDVGLLTIFSPSFLWFLLTLMQCTLIVVAVRAMLVRIFGAEALARAASIVGRWFASPAGAIIAALPYLIGLLIQGHSLSGIREPLTVVPELSSLIPYLGAFVVGWMLFAHRPGLVQVSRRWLLHLVAAVIFTVVAAPDLPLHRPLPVAATLTALAAWAWTYALLGLCTRFLTRERPAIRYLADASYWMYLIHMPILLGCEVLVAGADLPIFVKLLFTLSITFAVLLLSYHFLVRSTWLGKWLNGRRHPFHWSPRSARGPKTPAASE